MGKKREGRKIEKIEMKLEDLEREKRKKNVVMFNLKESDKEEPLERYKEDEKVSRTLFENELGFGNVNIINMSRLGKRLESSTRPLLIKLGSE